jgi:hypothetical protein
MNAPFDTEEEWSWHLNATIILVPAKRSKGFTAGASLLAICAYRRQAGSYVLAS